MLTSDAKPFCDWTMLTAWLEADWHALGQNYEAGMAEAFSSVAEHIRDLPPDMPAEEKLTRLYVFLERCLMGSTEEQIEEDDA